MAFIDCAECGGKTGAGTATCPHCGAPMPPGAASARPGNRGAGTGGKFALCLAAVVVLLVIALIVGPKNWSAIPVQTVAGQLPGSN